MPDLATAKILVDRSTKPLPQGSLHSRHRGMDSSRHTRDHTAPVPGYGTRASAVRIMLIGHLQPNIGTLTLDIVCF